MGSVRKTTPTRRCPNGRYEARWYDPEGTQRTRVFDTLTQPKRHIAAMEADRHRGDYLDPNLGRTPLRAVARAWLDTNPGNKERTRMGYEALLRNHVLPRLGDKPVGRISKSTVRQFVAELEDAGCGPGTVRNVMRNVMKPLLDLAVDDGMLRANPCCGARPATKRPRGNAVPHAGPH